MRLKFIEDGDVINYRKPSLFIGFSECSGKCDKENGTNLCHGKRLNICPCIERTPDQLLDQFRKSSYSRALVLGGLEPFDSFRDLYDLTSHFRSGGEGCDIVIYTGYDEDEVLSNKSAWKRDSEDWPSLLGLGNVIVKYGRFIPNRPKRFDEVLGVTLISDNQYARRY